MNSEDCEKDRVGREIWVLTFGDIYVSIFFSGVFVFIGEGGVWIRFYSRVYFFRA